LHGSSAGADHGDAFAVELDIVGPQRGVQYLALEILLTLEVRRMRIIELADRADENGRFKCLLAIGGL
jgi:hypothetical protein